MAADEVIKEDQESLRKTRRASDRVPLTSHKRTLHLMPDRIRAELHESGILRQWFLSRPHNELLCLLGPVLVCVDNSDAEDTVELSVSWVDQVVALATTGGTVIRVAALSCIKEAVSAGLSFESTQSAVAAITDSGLSSKARQRSAGLSAEAADVLVACLQSAATHAAENFELESLSKVLAMVLPLLYDPCASRPNVQLPPGASQEALATVGIPGEFVGLAVPSFPKQFETPTVKMLEYIALKLISGVRSTAVGWMLRGSIVRAFVDRIAAGNSFVQASFVVDHLLQMDEDETEDMANAAMVLELEAEDKHKVFDRERCAALDLEGRALAGAAEGADEIRR